MSLCMYSVNAGLLSGICGERRGVNRKVDIVKLQDPECGTWHTQHPEYTALMAHCSPLCVFSGR